jgi:hypothetical protein
MLPHGSFNLTFADVTVDPQGGGFGTTPSKGHSFRVDLMSGGAGALVTPRWGTPTFYVAQILPDSVVLQGKGSYFENYSTDTWDTITLARRAGELSGTFTAKGTEQSSGGDVISTANVTAAGPVAVDAIAPEVRIDGQSQLGPDGALLPWDPIGVRFAEPVTGDSSPFSTFAISSSAGKSVPVQWDANPGLPAPFVGFIVGTARRSDFLPTGASTVAWSTGLTDFTGNVLAPLNQPLAFVDLPVVAKQHSLDGDVATVATWGATALLGGLTGSDPACESGGCAELGVFSDGYCQQQPTRLGLAARLDTNEATTITFRYRVFVEDRGGPPYIPAALTLQTASPLGQVAVSTVMPASGDFTKLATPYKGLAWATAWSTASVNVTGKETGVTIAGGLGPSTGPCGLAPAPMKTIVVVDTISAQ